MGSKMNRMVLLYMLALFMVSLPTSLAKHFLVETADNQRGDDYHRSHPRLPPSGGSDYRRPKKNYKKELTKIIDDMKRQGMDYGIMDILGTAWGFVKPMVKPAWEVVKPVVKEGAKALVGQLTKGSENSDKTEEVANQGIENSNKTEEVAKEGEDYCWGCGTSPL